MVAGGDVVHARAPLRVSFAGGGTDVPPAPEIAGGAVLSATIELYAYASVDSSAPAGFRSPDLETAAALSGREALARSVLKAFSRDGDVVLHCDAPPGSGLGSSSSIVVALCAAASALAGDVMTSYELAERATQIERVDLGIPGGLQDQYAAAFGGLNFIEFEADSVLVNPLRISSETHAELQSSLVLVSTPQVQRRSSGILDRQIESYERADPEVLGLLKELSSQAFGAKSALLRGDLGTFAEVLHEGWLTKRRLATGVATDEIDELYDLARGLGAAGGKLLGAGGGGYLLVLVPFGRRGDLVSGLRRAGHATQNLSFGTLGAQVWRHRE